MKFAGKRPNVDRSTIIYNPNIAVSGIPLEAYDYVVNGKSAIDWVMERQCVKTDTAITGLIKEGVDLPTVQRISGHKTLAMVLRYTHLTDDHVDRSVAKLDAAFEAAFTPKLHTQDGPIVRDAA